MLPTARKSYLTDGSTKIDLSFYSRLVESYTQRHPDKLTGSSKSILLAFITVFIEISHNSFPST